MANGPYPNVGIDWFLDRDPTVPPGQAAPLEQFLIRTDEPSLYYKSGPGDTDWTAIGAGGGGGAGISSVPEMWNQNPVPASQTGVALETLVSVTFADIKMIRDGSIVGIRTRFLTNVSAGTATVKITKNGAIGTLGVVSTNASNQGGASNTQDEGIDTYVAGDSIGVKITTDGSFAPTDNSIEVTLEYLPAS